MLSDASKNQLKPETSNHALSSTILQNISSNNQSIQNVNLDRITFTLRLSQKFQEAWQVKMHKVSCNKHTDSSV